MDHYKTALNILPSYLEAHNDLAILLQETGDLQGAGERLPRGWMRLGADVIRAGPNRTVAKRVARKKQGRSSRRARRRRKRHCFALKYPLV